MKVGRIRDRGRRRRSIVKLGGLVETVRMGWDGIVDGRNGE